MSNTSDILSTVRVFADNSQRFKLNHSSVGVGEKKKKIHECHHFLFLNKKFLYKNRFFFSPPKI